ncbi:MAG: hypothetical protein JXQ73_24885 [Phycisphaerae bacterium]|nr:hypothetical protein [Phycisphaerae bacterium]
MCTSRFDFAAGAMLSVAACLCLSASARAELIEVSAECEAKVVETVFGDLGTEDSALERYPETTSVLPMRVDAGVTREISEEVKGIGLAFSQFKDPRIQTDEIPDELNLDAAAYSRPFFVGYEVVARVKESRKIQPTASETNRLDGEETEFLSSFYIQGLLVAVAEIGKDNLDGLMARVTARVVHERPGREPQAVLQAVYELRGKSNRRVELVTSGQADPNGVSDLDLSPLLGEIETLRVALLPAVRMDYAYHATIGETSTLTATLLVELESIPGGTGVGAAFGMPGEKIGQVIDAVVGGTTGSKTVQSINNAISALPPPALDFLTPPGQGTFDVADLLGPLCPVSGIVGMIGFVAVLGRAGAGRRGRL